ncbi:MAG TPA: hypothetical protein VHJ69_01775 [Gemmatimonadales bacterium]|jgi:hypothetical protein|nr:hypothetical protein [Gemmatimonadales bacterium]
MTFRTTTLLTALALVAAPVQAQQVKLGGFWAGGGLRGASTVSTATVKGGLGLVRYHAGTDDPNDDGLSAGALGLQLGR